MKKLMIPLMALAIISSSSAQIKQTWYNSLIDPDLVSMTKGVAVTPNGSTLVLSVMENSDLRVTRYDGLGAITWSKSFGVVADYNRALTLATDSAGNAIVGYSLENNDTFIAKISDDGSLSWTKQISGIMRIEELAVDAQDNIVAAGYGALLQGFGPVIKKLSPAGGVLFTHVSAASSYNPTDLAVAANGNIYYSAVFSTNGSMLEALTPNGTTRFAKNWVNANAYTSNPVYVATDRNGRLVAAEVKTTDSQTINIRTFDSAGNFVLDGFTVANADRRTIAAKFDANGRLVIGTSTSLSGGPIYYTVDWFTVSDTGVKSLASAFTNAQAGFTQFLHRMFVDAFGQTYLCGRRASGASLGQVLAFDENHTQPTWIHNDAGGAVAASDATAAVGRWGQVALATTQGNTHIYEAVNGVKQLGLRNLTINGSSFTGGRTITGTVNFYSSDLSDRSVTLSSNSSYAVTSAASVIAAGQSQSTMSIDLKPTAVRRAIRIDGVHNGTMRSAYFYIEPPVASSLTLFPTTVKGGKPVNATARINGAAPTNGIAVLLQSNSPKASVPASVNVPEGAVTKGFTVSTSVVSQTTTATISSTANSVTKTALLTITP